MRMNEACMDAISPLDGRYGERLAPLAAYFSEPALMGARVRVELQYLEALDTTALFPALTPTERDAMGRAGAAFTAEDYQRIKAIERSVHHDVKACELYLRERLPLANPNMIHFGLTSEDVNNLAYSLLLKSFVGEQLAPLLRRLVARLAAMAAAGKAVPFPARTHGQLASPSTAGKEMAVFLARLLRQNERLVGFRFRGKLNGATGNYQALAAAFPGHDWPAFALGFVSRLGLEFNPATTQIEDHDAWGELFYLVRQINTIVLDLDTDLWLYLALGYFEQAADRKAVGSSTMPHKVNPIHFENSEGNIAMANALLAALAEKLGHSRLQRDLSDSTVARNIGVALAHSILAWQETLRGLDEVAVNPARCRAELENNPQLLAEPIQTILRAHGHPDPYTLLKELTRGRTVTAADLRAFIDRLDVPEELRERLRRLEVTAYTGFAERITDDVLRAAATVLGETPG